MSVNATEQPPMSFRVRSALFEIAVNEPDRAPRWVLWSVATLVGILIVWATFAKLDIVAVAEGRLVPQTYVKIVQPAQAGIVREILVDEGDEVAKGQVLVRLDPTENRADSTAIGRELAMQRLQVRRVDAELRGRAVVRGPNDDPSLLAQVEAQRAAHTQAFRDAVSQEESARERALKELAAGREVLDKLEKTLPSYERSASAHEKLASQQLIGTILADEKRREATEKAQDLRSQRSMVASVEAAVMQSSRRMAQLKSSYHSDLHNIRLEAVNKITQLEQEEKKLQYQETNLELRAPQAGRVKELATTTVGAVVQPGTVLLSLVPVTEPLYAEVSIKNDDIGFVREGQVVRLKLATYPFQKYGMLEGVVRTVSADSSSFKSSNGPSGSLDGRALPEALNFKALVKLKEQRFAIEDHALPLTAGMQLSAEIVQGTRTVMEYLLSPVQRVTSEAGIER